MDESLSRYIKAVHPQKFRVLGVDLLDFSLGHHTLLAALENAFVSVGRKPELKDLIQATFVCSRPYSVGVVEVHSKAFTIFTASIHRRLALRRWLVRLRLLPLASTDVDEMCGVFSRYVLVNSILPEIVPQCGEPTKDSEEEIPKWKLGTPLLQWVKITLMADLNHTPHEAYEKRWGEALHDAIGWRDMHGMLRVASEEDRELHEEHLEILSQRSEEIDALIKQVTERIQRKGDLDGSNL